MRFGTWNVRSLYRPVSLTTLARELGRYKAGLVGVQEVRCDKEGTVRVLDYNFVYGKGRENHWLGTGTFVHHRIVSAVTRVEFVSDRMWCIVLRGHWFNIIVLNVQAPSKEKTDDSKDNCYEWLVQSFNHFPKCHIKENSVRRFLSKTEDRGNFQSDSCEWQSTSG